MRWGRISALCFSRLNAARELAVPNGVRLAYVFQAGKGFRTLRVRVTFVLAKVTKTASRRAACRCDEAASVPCASRVPGRCGNSLRSNTPRLHPRPAAMLGTLYGSGR